jgi:hypothetical protein
LLLLDEPCQQIADRPALGQVRPDFEKEAAQIHPLHLVGGELAGGLPQLTTEIIVRLARIEAKGLQLLFLGAVLFDQLFVEAVDLLLKPDKVPLHHVKLLLVVTHLRAKDDIPDAFYVLGTGPKLLVAHESLLVSVWNLGSSSPTIQTGYGLGGFLATKR